MRRRRYLAAVAGGALPAVAGCASIEQPFSDETETANDHLRTANEDIRAFNRIGPPTIRDVAVALGLIRSISRDDTVIDTDDEGI